ncbi:MAG: fumarylacetoacetate hydrolase family protein [Pseudomonadota bacterium]
MQGIDISALSSTPGDIPSVYKVLGYDRIINLLQLAPQTALHNYSYSVLESPAGTKSLTDRAYLMRNIDMDNMRSGKGFNGAKSVPGYFPTGPYMVIPKNRKEFIKDIDFSLARNGDIKQHANAGEMIWPLDTFLRQTFNAHTHRTPTFAESSKQWLPENMLSADTVIVTGTPQGVIIKPPNLGFKILYGSKYIFSGAVFSMKATDYIIDEYIKFLTKEEIFLQPGEKILMRAKFLGKIRVKIE